MKGWMKGLMIASAICIGTGTAMCATAWAMGGRFSYYRYKNFGFVEERENTIAMEEIPFLKEGNRAEQTVTQILISDGTEQVFTEELPFDEREIRKLEVEVIGGKVALIADDSVEKVEIIINNSRYQLHHEIDDDKLELRVDLKEPFWNSGDLELSKAAEIHIPAEFEFQSVNLELKAGVLEVYDITTRKMELDLQAGQLIVDNADVQELETDCVAGELIYHGKVGQKLEADCLTAKAEFLLDGKEEDFHYKLEVIGGTIFINGEEKGKSNHEITINNPGAEKKAELECKAGEIVIEFQ